MKRIYKYPLQFATEQTIRLPANAKIISVANQDEQLVLYAIIDTEEKYNIERDIFVFGTGHELGGEVNALRFIGTALFHSGALVFHVFELANDKG